MLYVSIFYPTPKHKRQSEIWIIPIWIIQKKKKKKKNERKQKRQNKKKILKSWK